MTTRRREQRTRVLYNRLRRELRAMRVMWPRYGTSRVLRAMIGWIV